MMLVPSLSGAVRGNSGSGFMVSEVGSRGTSHDVALHPAARRAIPGGRDACRRTLARRRATGRFWALTFEIFFSAFQVAPRLSARHLRW
jgi:hypothetical protein